MDKDELIEFLKENLRVTVDVEGRAWDTPAIFTRVFLGDEKISEHEDSISPSDFQEREEW